MSEQPIHSEQQEADDQHAGDVFARLRRRLDELRGAQRGAADPEALARKLAERAQALRGQMTTSGGVGPQVSFLAFRHGVQRFAVPLADIIEIQPLSDYTPVPGAPAFIPGVIHWRGAILSLIDLVKLFGIPEAGLIDESACLIVGAAGRRVAILAGEVEELHSVPREHVKGAPDLPGGVMPDWVVGVHDQNRLILRVDAILGDERLTSWKKDSLNPPP